MIVLQEIIAVPPVLKNVLNEASWEPHGDKSAVDTKPNRAQGQSAAQSTLSPRFSRTLRSWGVKVSAALQCAEEGKPRGSLGGPSGEPVVPDSFRPKGCLTPST